MVAQLVGPLEVLDGEALAGGGELLLSSLSAAALQSRGRSSRMRMAAILSSFSWTKRANAAR